MGVFTLDASNIKKSPANLSVRVQCVFSLFFDTLKHKALQNTTSMQHNLATNKNHKRHPHSYVPVDDLIFQTEIQIFSSEVGESLTIAGALGASFH